MFQKKENILLIAILLSVFFGVSLFFYAQEIWHRKQKVNELEIQKNEKSQEVKQEVKPSQIYPTIVYSDEHYKVYSFDGYISVLDINFDNIPDVITKAQISGMDYHDWHEISEFYVYNFFIDKTLDMPNNEEYLNLVTKEVSGKKIEEFDRDFAIQYIKGACNKNETLRLVTIDGVKTILVIIKTENKKGTNGDIKSEQYANYELYELKSTGNRVGSDYIFSHLKTVRSKYASCDMDQFSNKNIVNIIKEEGF